MKKLFLVSIFIFYNFINLQAQSLSPFVISSSGGFYSNSSGQLSFTTAEMTLTETFAAGNSFLTQGFQQPSDFNTFIEDNKSVNFAFDAFPNPSSGKFTLMLKEEKESTVEVSVLDLTGNVILQNVVNAIAGNQQYPIHINSFSNGIYILRLTYEDHKSYFKKVQFIN